jgi:hypothetical protein
MPARRWCAFFWSTFSSTEVVDTAGNVYFSETATHNITVLSPTGKTTILASDPTLSRPDGSFISKGRKLYIPVKDPVTHTTSAGVDRDPRAPYVTYSLALPERFSGITPGSAVTGTKPWHSADRVRSE